jgi:Ribonuclease G/E
MDIDGVTGRIHPTKLAGQAKAKSDNTFAQILGRATDAVHPEAEPKDVPCSVTQVARAASCKVSRVDRQTLQHASKVLDVLEEYTQALKNPQVTLKSIEPIVIRLQQELKGLDVRSTPHLGQHDQLAELVNHIAVTAGVEAFKFQRGDYMA